MEFNKIIFSKTEKKSHLNQDSRVQSGVNSAAVDGILEQPTERRPIDLALALTDCGDGESVVQTLAGHPQVHLRELVELEPRLGHVAPAFLEHSVEPAEHEPGLQGDGDHGSWLLLLLLRCMWGRLSAAGAGECTLQVVPNARRRFTRYLEALLQKDDGKLKQKQNGMVE